MKPTIPVNHSQQKAIFAMLAATPLQVQHCLEMILNDVASSANHTDLYLIHSFRFASDLSERLKKSGIFCHVYDIKPRVYSGWKSKIWTFRKIFFPVSTLQKESVGAPFDLKSEEYRVLFASSQTSTTVAMHRAFSKAEIYLYDDGIGSYFGDITYDTNTPLFNFINRVFFHGRLNFSPTCFYLSNPEISKSKSGGEKLLLPRVKEEQIPLLDVILGYRENTVYRDRKAIYFTQPYEDENDGDPQIEMDLLKKLEPYKDHLILRFHPRQEIFAVGDLMRDEISNPWELECCHQISDDNILIANYSTAQFMPKFICDSEPYLIFTHRMLKRSLEDPSLLAAEEFISQFIKMYRDPTRVYIPDSQEEFFSVLNQLIRSDR